MRTIRYAKTVCWEQCPVRNECLDTALDSRIAYGIWGGFTEEERRSATREQLRGRRADDSEPVTAKAILAAKVDA